MSDSQNPGFGKFVPGFDFLQNLAKGTSETMPQMPNLANWIAPTLNLEELEKRISELKTVHFWLEQNSRALAATVQALEVQKMTLATLKGMNFNIGDRANALKPKAAQPATTAAAGLVDPMQLWSSLTQQFQQIAASAMKDADKNSAMDVIKNGVKKTATKAAKKTSGRTT